MSRQTAATIIPFLIQRDGCGCVWCGQDLIAERPPTLDHVIPRGRGGTGARSNLMLACSACNHRRGMRRVSNYAGALIRSQQPVKLGVLRARFAQLESELAAKRPGAPHRQRNLAYVERERQRLERLVPYAQQAQVEAEANVALAA